jgi:hypothetical protein
MVPGAFYGPLLMLLILHTRNKSLPILGLSELLPQHCQLPNLTPHQHSCALNDELADSAANASTTTKGGRLLKLLQLNIHKILNPGINLDKQRVRKHEMQEQNKG